MQVFQYKNPPWETPIFPSPIIRIWICSKTEQRYPSSSQDNCLPGNTTKVSSVKIPSLHIVNWRIYSGFSYQSNAVGDLGPLDNFSQPIEKSNLTHVRDPWQKLAKSDLFKMWKYAYYAIMVQKSQWWRSKKHPMDNRKVVDCQLYNDRTLYGFRPNAVGDLGARFENAILTHHTVTVHVQCWAVQLLQQGTACGQQKSGLPTVLDQYVT